MLTVKGILRIHARGYGLDLRRSMLEILSDIYYRMHSYDAITSGGALIAGKITV